LRPASKNRRTACDCLAAPEPRGQRRERLGQRSSRVSASRASSRRVASRTCCRSHSSAAGFAFQSCSFRNVRSWWTRSSAAAWVTRARSIADKPALTTTSKTPRAVSASARSADARSCSQRPASRGRIGLDRVGRLPARRLGERASASASSTGIVGSSIGGGAGAGPSSARRMPSASTLRDAPQRLHASLRPMCCAWTL
jgi:hypothetical protein